MYFSVQGVMYIVLHRTLLQRADRECFSRFSRKVVQFKYFIPFLYGTHFYPLLILRFSLVVTSIDTFCIVLVDKWHDGKFEPITNTFKYRPNANMSCGGTDFRLLLRYLTGVLHNTHSASSCSKKKYSNRECIFSAFGKEDSWQASIYISFPTTKAEFGSRPGKSWTIHFLKF